MPPFHDPHTLHRIQQHLSSTMIGFFLPSLERRVLEEQTNSVVAHVCADINCELKENGIKEVGSDRQVHRQVPLEEQPFIHQYFLHNCCSPIMILNKSHNRSLIHESIHTFPVTSRTAT